MELGVTTRQLADSITILVVSSNATLQTCIISQLGLVAPGDTGSFKVSDSHPHPQIACKLTSSELESLFFSSLA